MLESTPPAPGTEPASYGALYMVVLLKIHYPASGSAAASLRRGLTQCFY